MNNNRNREFKKNVNDEMKPSYGFYSRVLNKPFDSVAELRAAEEAHYAEIRAKENKAAAKKADATKVEVAFKALNAARKTYKENLLAITERYSKELKELKAAFEKAKHAEQCALADAEAAYQAALKEFTDKYPEGYHLTLKDGDFETTIEGHSSANKPLTKNTGLLELFDMLFNV